MRLRSAEAESLCGRCKAGRFTLPPVAGTGQLSTPTKVWVQLAKPDAIISQLLQSQLLQGFDLRNLRDALRLSSVGHALEAIRTAIHTSPMSLDVQFALEDR